MTPRWASTVRIPIAAPDLPFLGKAAECGKPEAGCIAMALPARTLFKLRDNSQNAQGGER
jgi:hypothetical protein